MQSVADSSRLLAPRSIAVVGASADHRLTRNLYRRLADSRLRGHVWAVNPKRTAVYEWPCVAALSDLPETPDLTVLMVGTNRVQPVLKELAEVGGRAAYVLADGFETAEKSTWLRDLCQDTGMRILGPNCNGFIDVNGNLPVWTGPTIRPYTKGHIAVIAQSSGIVAATVNSAWDRGLGLSWLISTGNEVDFKASDAVTHVAADEMTRAIICYVEEFRDYAAFAGAVGVARSEGVPTIIIPAGRSTSGRRATLSHTGSMTPGPAVTSAAIEAMGALEAHGLDEALDKASLFAQLAPRAVVDVKRVGVIAVSGGYATLTVDALEDAGLEVPQLPEDLAPHFPSDVTAQNPVDLTPHVYEWPDRYQELVKSFVDAPTFDAVVTVWGAWEGLERWFGPVWDHARLSKKPVILGGVEEMALSDGMRAVFDRQPLPFVQGSKRLARALAALHEFSDRRQRITDDWSVRTGDGSAHGMRDTPILKALAAAGVPVAREFDPADPELVFPVVLKLDASELAHKTEIGGVIPGVEGPTELANAVRLLTDRAHQAGLDSWRIIAQEQIAADFELLAGVVVDPRVGPVLTLSPGGVLAELSAATVHALCPLDSDTALALVDRLGIARLASGYRGKRSADLQALADVVVSLSQLAYRWRDDLLELDVNPIMLSPGGAVAVDAWVRFKDDRDAAGD